MVALELLERSGDEYSNSPVSAVFLTGRTPADLRAFLKFWDRISYPAWTALGEALAAGKPPTQVFDLDDEQQAIVSAGIEAVLVGPDRPLLHPNVVAERSGWSEYNMFMHLNSGLAKRVI